MMRQKLHNLTETLFDRSKQPPILRMIADRPWWFRHFSKHFSDSRYVFINFSMLKEPPPDSRHGARNVSGILEFVLHSVVCPATPYDLPSNFFFCYFLGSEERLWKASMCVNIDDFVRWTSRGRCSQSKLKLLVPFILRPEKPLRCPFECISTWNIWTTS